MSEFTTANLQFIEDYDRVEPGEASSLASELLALRERAEPVVVPDELPEFAPADVLKRYFNWTDDGDAEVFSMGWNACRAAMLAAPGKN